MFTRRNHVDLDRSLPERDAVTFGSLFSGIGGLDLGLERAGMEVRWQVENDPYCLKVLEKHWPDVPRYGDIRDIKELPYVDLICGGFPCQPVSLAGKRLGQDDERWLWPEFERVIRMVRPRIVLVENVPGLLVRGFPDVLGDLAALGFDAEWGVLSAADMGAPHLRKRVFIVGWDPLRRRNGSGDWEVKTLQRGAAPNTNRGGEVSDANSKRGGVEQISKQGGGNQAKFGNDGQAGDVAHPDDQREPQPQGGEPGQRGRSGNGGEQVADADSARLQDVQGSPTSTECKGRGTSNGAGWWDTEPDVGRVAHGVPKRVDRLRALGNAVVPQCAEAIGRMIMEEA